MPSRSPDLQWRSAPPSRASGYHRPQSACKTGSGLSTSVQVSSRLLPDPERNGRFISGGKDAPVHGLTERYDRGREARRVWRVQPLVRPRKAKRGVRLIDDAHRVGRVLASLLVESSPSTHAMQRNVGEPPVLGLGRARLHNGTRRRLGGESAPYILCDVFRAETCQCSSHKSDCYRPECAGITSSPCWASSPPISRRNL